MADKEAGEANGAAVQRNESNSEAAELFRSVTNGSISAELFEQLYLSPRNGNQNDFRKTFANPTPLAIMGFSIAVFPLSISLMGWRGAGGNTVATDTCSLWFGGLLLIICGFMEFILGNTFPFIVFMGFGAHFLTFSTTFMPAFNSVAYFSGSKTADGVTTAEGGLPPLFAASYAYYTLAMLILCFIFLICSLRTNLVFVFLFAFAGMGFAMITAGLFALSTGDAANATKYIIGTGACFFGATMLGFYLFMSIMFSVMELPIPDLPVFDLSTVVKAKKRR